MSFADHRLRLVVFGVVLVVLLAAPAVAHGNYLAVDSQVSTDGTVRVEAAALNGANYVVLHADDPGGTDDVVGHAAPEENVFLGDLSVSMDESYWANVTGAASVWVTLHYDADNDGQFTPAGDPPVGGRDDPDHAVRITVRRGEAPAYVLAETDHGHQTDGSEVSVRGARLPTDGYLVVRTDADGEPGDVIGHRNLQAGLHENVTVPLDDHAYRHLPEEATLWAVLYTDDGDGEFGQGDDPITADGTPVASRFDIERTDDLTPEHAHTASPTATDGTASPTDTEHDHDGDATATPTATEHDHDHDHDEDATPSPGSTSVPGVGAPGALLALGLVVLAARLRDG